MTGREYQYGGYCDDCDRRVRVPIHVASQTSRPDPVKWAACAECGDIVAVSKLSVDEVQNGHGGNTA